MGVTWWISHHIRHTYGVNGETGRHGMLMQGLDGRIYPSRRWTTTAVARVSLLGTRAFRLQGLNGACLICIS